MSTALVIYHCQNANLTRNTILQGIGYSVDHLHSTTDQKIIKYLNTCYPQGIDCLWIMHRDLAFLNNETGKKVFQSVRERGTCILESGDDELVSKIASYCRPGVLILSGMPPYSSIASNPDSIASLSFEMKKPDETSRTDCTLRYYRTRSGSTFFIPREILMIALNLFKKNEIVQLIGEILGGEKTGEHKYELCVKEKWKEGCGDLQDDDLQRFIKIWKKRRRNKPIQLASELQEMLKKVEGELNLSLSDQNRYVLSRSIPSSDEAIYQGCLRMAALTHYLPIVSLLDLHKDQTSTGLPAQIVRLLSGVDVNPMNGKMIKQTVDDLLHNFYEVLNKKYDNIRQKYHAINQLFIPTSFFEKSLVVKMIHADIFNFDDFFLGFFATYIGSDSNSRTLNLQKCDFTKVELDQLILKLTAWDSQKFRENGGVILSNLHAFSTNLKKHEEMNETPANALWQASALDLPLDKNMAVKMIYADILYDFNEFFLLFFASYIGDDQKSRINNIQKCEFSESELNQLISKLKLEAERYFTKNKHPKLSKEKMNQILTDLQQWLDAIVIRSLKNF